MPKKKVKPVEEVKPVVETKAAPPVEIVERDGKTIAVRLTLDEAARWKLVAKDLGLTISSMLRVAVRSLERNGSPGDRGERR
jgi:transposase-like protein